MKQLENVPWNMCFERTSLGFMISFVFWLVSLFSDLSFVPFVCSDTIYCKRPLSSIYRTHKHVHMHRFTKKQCEDLIIIMNRREYARQKNTGTSDFKYDSPMEYESLCVFVCPCERRWMCADSYLTHGLNLLQKRSTLIVMPRAVC